jgi:hypothetical protein
MCGAASIQLQQTTVTLDSFYTLASLAISLYPRQLVRDYCQLNSITFTRAHFRNLCVLCAILVALAPGGLNCPPETMYHVWRAEARGPWRAWIARSLLAVVARAASMAALPSKFRFRGYNVHYLYIHIHIYTCIYIHTHQCRALRALLRKFYLM